MPHLPLHSLVLSLAFDAFAVDPTPVPEPVDITETSQADHPLAPSADPLALRVHLDLAKLPADDAAHLGPDIRATIDPQLAREPLVLSVDAPHRLVIHVELLDADALDYAVDFELLLDSIPLDPPIERLYCRICTQVELVELVAQGLARALATLPAAIEPPPPAPVEPPPAADSPTAPTESPRPPAPSPILYEHPEPPKPRPRVRWLGPVGGLGIVLAVGGTTTVALGTIVLRQSRGPGPSSLVALLSNDRDPDRSGWLLYGAGLAVTAIGGVMLATDVTALRERRVRRLAAHPTFTPTHAGVVVRGRF